MEIGLAETLGAIGVLVTALASIGVAVISKLRGRDEAAGISADTIVALTQAVSKQQATIDELGVSLERERDARHEDCRSFDQQLHELREWYRERINEAIAETEERMRGYYEEKIERLEQAHKDRVWALKQRVRTLESKLEELQNGKGN